jgi:hypothetical protein
VYTTAYTYYAIIYRDDLKKIQVFRNIVKAC